MITLEIKALILLATLDLILTFAWIAKWNYSKVVKDFKHKIPVKLIEANPIIRKSIKDFGIEMGLAIGYIFVFIIQLALVMLHVALAFIVLTFLSLANILHIKNILGTSDEYVEKITREYNERMSEKEGEGSI